MNQAIAGDRAFCEDANCIWRKASLRLVPLLIVCYLCAFLDRIDIAFPTDAWVVTSVVFALGVGACAARSMSWRLPMTFIAPVLLGGGMGLTSSFGGMTSFLATYLMVVWDTAHSSVLDL